MIIWSSVYFVTTYQLPVLELQREGERERERERERDKNSDATEWDRKSGGQYFQPKKKP